MVFSASPASSLHKRLRRIAHKTLGHDHRLYGHATTPEGLLAALTFCAHHRACLLGLVLLSEAVPLIFRADVVCRENGLSHIGRKVWR